MSKKQKRREKARLRKLRRTRPEGREAEYEPEEKREADRGILKKLKKIYEKDYKKLMLLTFIIFLLALVQIGWQTAATGDFINKGVSLKGGATITAPNTDYDAGQLERELENVLPENDIRVRTLTGMGGSRSLIVEADVSGEKGVDILESEIAERLQVSKDEYTTSFVGSSLGANFFRQTIIAVIIAFIAMALVVFIYFRVVIPSLAVIISAASDIIVTIAIANLLGMSFSTGSIAALLMLIGYSVDTDILLTTRLFKRKEGTLEESIYSSAKTGLTMTLTSIAAITAAIILSQSAELSQIMSILLIGLIVDVPNTWIQNTGILKWYIESRRKKEGEDVKA